MKKLTSIILAIVFTLSITLAVVNSSLSTTKTDLKKPYAAMVFKLPNKTPPNSGCNPCNK